MKNDSLVSINLTIGNILVNPTKQPILFYWDGTGDLQDIIKTNNDILNIFKENCLTYDDFLSASINYFRFDYINNEEKYVEEFIYLSSCIGLDQMDESIWINEVKPYFDFLYTKSFGEPYIFKENVKDDFKTIVDKLKEKYPGKVSSTTIINYIRSKLSKNIAATDKDIILENVTKIIGK